MCGSSSTRRRTKSGLLREDRPLSDGVGPSRRRDPAVQGAGIGKTPMTATKLTINQRILTDRLFARQSGGADAVELAEKIQLARKNHLDLKNTKSSIRFRFSVPAACIVFAWSACLPRFSSPEAAFRGRFAEHRYGADLLQRFVISTEILSKVDFIPAWVARVGAEYHLTLLGVFRSGGWSSRGLFARVRERESGERGRDDAVYRLRSNERAICGVRKAASLTPFLRGLRTGPLSHAQTS